MNRRQKLNNLAVTEEEQQTYASSALAAQAAYQQALANLDHVRGISSARASVPRSTAT